MYTDLDTVVPLIVVVLNPQVQFLVELSSWMSGIVDVNTQSDMYTHNLIRT